MAMAVGDLIEVIDSQSYLGEQCLNVYYYVCTTLGPIAGDELEEMATEFNAFVIDPVIQVQLDLLLHTSRTYKNLTNGVDFFVDTSIIPGTLAFPEADALPSYVSLGFQLQRSTLVVRNGYKRFAGLYEGSVTGNESNIAAPLIEAIEDGLAWVLPTIGGDFFTPVIVKRPIPLPGVGGAIYSEVASANFRGVGTQNTRKPRRSL